MKSLKFNIVRKPYNIGVRIVSEEKEVLEIKVEVPKTPGVFEFDDTIVVKGDEYIKNVTSALSSTTRLKILKYLREEGAYVGKAAELIAQSKANASAQIRILESAGLVKSTYEPGKRGVKKISKAKVKRIIIILD